VTDMLQVQATSLRDRVEQSLAEGERFAAGWASTRDGHPAWRVLMSSPRGMRALTCSADGELPSITDLAPAADWDEREARDLWAVCFAGEQPARSLASHTARPEDWMTPVSGAGVHQVAVGPIHAGVIESGHFRLHVVGERILRDGPASVLQASRTRACSRRARRRRRDRLRPASMRRLRR